MRKNRSTRNAKPRIGFIGQGFIGKNYSDEFERRGYNIVRYAKEVRYEQNASVIQECDIVFIAVPTPTTPKGFDYSIVQSVLPLVGKGKTAVIKSTLLPGTTRVLQRAFPQITILHSPEFLTEATAAHDAAHPLRNIVGMPKDTPIHRRRARAVLKVLPSAPYELICTSEEAELIKYGGNCSLYLKVVFMNMLYDYARKLGCDWKTIAEALVHDPRIGSSHMRPKHQSGRGAGGNCFIKDFQAFIEGYASELPHDREGIAALSTIRDKNHRLLRDSRKDLKILRGVTGK